MKRFVVLVVLAGLVVLAVVPAAGAVSSSHTVATVAATPKTLDLAPYFLIDEAGHEGRTGPFLVPLRRRVPYTLGVGVRSMEKLLNGPRKAEKSGIPAISTAIPEGVQLLWLRIVDGKARVNLSSDFGADDGSAAAAVRVAQVVYTLTRFPTIDRVRFLQDGEPIAVPTGSGRLVNRAVTRNDYLEYVAAISVETPIYRGVTKGAVRVTGIAAVFEAQFNYALTDWDGRIIAEGAAMADDQMWGSFDFTIPYTVSERQRGSLIVWDYSAKDGSMIDVREYPVVLRP
jgi:hypothetical protein